MIEADRKYLRYALTEPLLKTSELDRALAILEAEPVKPRVPLAMLMEVSGFSECAEDHSIGLSPDYIRKIAERYGVEVEG